MLNAFEVFGVSLVTLLFARMLSADINVRVNQCECYYSDNEEEQEEQEEKEEE